MDLRVMILECGACGHQWPEFVTLPMKMRLFRERLRSWESCPNCHRVRKRGKEAIGVLQGQRYREALARLRKQGLIPDAIQDDRA